MGFSSLPAWAMDCYAEHEGGNTVVIGYVPRISIPSDGKKVIKSGKAVNIL